MFKRQQNESPYGKIVTVTETVFHKTEACFRIFRQNCHSEFHENTKVALIADVL